MDGNTQRLMAASMTPIKLLPGQMLCQQGALAESIWLLQEGTPSTLCSRSWNLAACFDILRLRL